MYRDEDLYARKVADMMRVYRKVAPLCWLQKEAERKVVAHRAECFYIQGHAAYSVLRKVFYGETDEIPVCNANSRRMYEEIYRRVLAKSLSPEYEGLGLRELCDIVVEEEAPEFYMSPASFRHILSMERAKLRKEGRHAVR